ncbi:hypothetical protein [Nocardia araoensis]|uniref:hypothetical protein n=1 Tax=Nocardia araoensis TaxID=228600 RepID=UPI0012F6A4DA|nr:hypothetical protein [Nocardia araoensis]
MAVRPVGDRWRGRELRHRLCGTPTQSPPLGDAADGLLRLAVSIAHGRPVDLRGTLPGLGHAHASAVVTATVRASGLAW